MQILFQLDTGQSDPEKIFIDFLPEEPASEPARDFAKELVRGVWKNLKAIDKELTQTTIDWTLERLGKLDKAILRLGAYELLFTKKLPPAVIINEALDLAHKYVDAPAVPFINGILDKISRGGKKRPTSKPTKRVKTLPARKSASKKDIE